MMGLRMSLNLPSLDDEGETKVVSTKGLTCLWLTKAANDHDWSSCVI